MTFYEKLMYDRARETEKAIKSGELVKAKIYTDHRYTECYKVYNAPDTWDEQDAINYCDRCCFGGHATKNSEGIWYVECNID